MPLPPTPLFPAFARSRHSAFAPRRTSGQIPQSYILPCAKPPAPCFLRYAGSKKRFSDEKIVILISHRLASVENCKCNYVFSQGRLIGWGNHKELMRNNPEYIELVNTQKEIENYGGQANAKTE